MHTSIIVSVLLGAGALAHPHFKLNNPLAHVHHKRQQPVQVITTTVGNEVVVEDIFVQTVTGGPAPSSSSAAPVAAPERLVAPVKEEQHQQHTSAAPAPVITTSAAPVPVSTPASVTPSVTPTPQTPSGGNDGAPQSGGVSILDTANKYRSLMGLPTYTYSSQLEGNAAKTNKDDGGNSMTHELNPGSMAQCIAQGNENTSSGSYTPFELTYLGWLCEIPDSRLGDACNVMESATHMQISDDGHARILRNMDGQYSKMGCNFLESTAGNSYGGLWTCDFS